MSFTEPAEGTHIASIPEFCEDYNTSNERCFGLRNHMNDVIARESTDGSRVCYLVVSHGYFINDVTKIVKQEMIQMEAGGKYHNDLLKDKKQVIQATMDQNYQYPDYCAITSFSVDSKSNDLSNFQIRH